MKMVIEGDRVIDEAICEDFITLRACGDKHHYLFRPSVFQNTGGVFTWPFI